MEWLVTGVGCFVTLTYNEDNIPQDRNLDKKELQLFIRRLKKRHGKIRYFACGEYGLVGKRPHYHLIIFGWFIPAKIIQKDWGKGRVQVGELNKYTAQYVAGYLNKKLTKEGDKLLFGKKPEFSLMSRRPGIGFNAVKILTEGMSKLCFQNEFELNGDVASTINFGKEVMPLGRYIKTKLRENLGYDSIEKQERRMYAQSVKKCVELQEQKDKAEKLNRNLESVRLEEKLQKIAKIEKRTKIYSRRNKL